MPNYNIFGQQHHRLPTKDKGHFAKTVKEKSEWTRTPRHRSAAAMFSARRAAKHPDLSYDLDGDGAVGSTDYFIGKQFSVEHDHRLNTAERENAVKALENGLLDGYSFGHDHFGAQRPFPFKQIRGKIISVDNVGDLSEVYPAHWNAENVPRFQTATDLRQHRRAELANASELLQTAHDAKFPDKVPEPPVPREPMPSTMGQSMGARREAKRREAREYAGLDPTYTHINPRRELQTGTTLEYTEEPTQKTRTGMQAERKNQMREELQQARREAEMDYVPMTARHTARDAVEYEERRADPKAKTLNKLRHQRKVENIEHNMSNFQLRQVEHARFSEQQEPWWSMQKGYVHEPVPCTLKTLTDSSKEITGKVTQTCPPPRGAGVVQLEQALGDSLQEIVNVPQEYSEADHKTLHRWTTEFVPQHVNQTAPRCFDGVKQAPTYSLDTAELDQYSSFNCISKTAISKTAERQRKVATEDEDRARAWKLSIRGLPDHNDKGDHSESLVGLSGASTSRGPPGASILAAAQQSLSSAESIRRVPIVPRGTEACRSYTKVEPLADPLGEDAPMTSRLNRILTGRLGRDVVAMSASPDEDFPSPSVSRDLPDMTRNSPSRSKGLGARGEDRTLRPTTDALDTKATVEAQGLVVRTGGFQWVESQKNMEAGCCVSRQPSLVECSSSCSLLRTPQETVRRNESTGSASVRRPSPY